MERGLLGLYGGCAINLLLITPEKAIKLVVNDKMRTRLTDKDGNLSVQKQIIAGATAGACQCIITSPMEMFKIAGQTGVPVGEMWRQRYLLGNSFQNSIFISERLVVLEL